MRYKLIIFLVVLSLFHISKLCGQEKQNIADIDYLYNLIRKLPSYKDQLKSDESYQHLYETLRKDLNTDNELEVFQKLLKLVYPIKDNHLGFWRNPDVKLNFESLKQQQIMPDVLKTTTYSIDSIEGIYFDLNNDEELHMFEETEHVYNLQNRLTGKLKMILRRKGSQTFDVIRFMDGHIPYALYRNVKLINGKLGNLGYSKIQSESRRINQSPYEYKNLGENIGYLRLGTFNSSDANIDKSTEFLDTIRSKIYCSFLIVDLRNNGGGGYKTSRQFLSFLKKYKGKIFLLQDANTVSNAEQFVLDIRVKKKVITMGETTRGTLTYGSNYGQTFVLPSNRFVFYPTDMRGKSKHLIYEDVGITPDIKIDSSEHDWLDYVVKYIKDNNSGSK